MKNNMKDITLEQIKNIILEQDCLVSQIPCMGPVTVLFTKPKNITDENLTEKWYYENQILEMGNFDLSQDGLQGFEQEVKNIKNQSKFTPIFCLYNLLVNEYEHLILRYAHSYGGYYEPVQITIQEAQEIINNPKKYLKHARLSFIQDLKAVYKL